ncbi:hypothetical protein E4T56_gene7994 [Termitomyces sp. T112]|nr:hypothetical protein E4T56_gene7994 [Termitomyces sp. T112]
MLTRPSPLQLVFDNTAPGLRPVSVPQPQLFPVVESSKSRFFVQVGVFAAQVYRADWRNFVIAIAAVNAFRFIASAWTFFYDVDIDLSTYHVSKLAQISLALGALYLLTAFIQIFGAISTALVCP